MNTKTLSVRSTLHIPTVIEAVAGSLRLALAAWRAQRRQALDRRQLAEMSDSALSDLGIGRDQIQQLTGGAIEREDRAGR